MTKIKLCGITREDEIEAVNGLLPEYIGFVFAKKSRRYVSFDRARILKSKLSKNISAVGVFVNEPIENVVRLLNDNVIDIAQLHGDEDDTYIDNLHRLSNKPIIKAFCIKDESNNSIIENCRADYVLLDSGKGSGECFDWSITKGIKRQFFLAGGLDAINIFRAIEEIHPYAVDVSSGIETDNVKDIAKMTAFVKNARKM